MPVRKNGHLFLYMDCLLSIDNYMKEQCEYLIFQIFNVSENYFLRNLCAFM